MFSLLPLPHPSLVPSAPLLSPAFPHFPSSLHTTSPPRLPTISAFRFSPPFLRLPPHLLTPLPLIPPLPPAKLLHFLPPRCPPSLPPPLLLLPHPLSHVIPAQRPARLSPSSSFLRALSIRSPNASFELSPAALPYLTASLPSTPLPHPPPPSQTDREPLPLLLRLSHEAQRPLCPDRPSQGGPLVLLTQSGDSGNLGGKVTQGESAVCEGMLGTLQGRLTAPLPCSARTWSSAASAPGMALCLSSTRGSSSRGTGTGLRQSASLLSPSLSSTYPTTATGPPAHPPSFDCTLVA